MVLRSPGTSPCDSWGSISEEVSKVCRCGVLPGVWRVRDYPDHTTSSWGSPGLYLVRSYGARN